jgi:hypothetical protein
MEAFKEHAPFCPNPKRCPRASGRQSAGVLHGRSALWPTGGPSPTSGRHAARGRRR